MNPLQQLYQEYPRLRRYQRLFRFKDSSGRRGAQGRKLEFYLPTSGGNPFPGFATVERFDPCMSMHDVLGEIFSHFLPLVDPVFAQARREFMASLTQAQLQELRGDYEYQMAASRPSLWGGKKPEFPQWLGRQGGDGAFRGYVARQYPPEFYTAQQIQIFERLLAYLRAP